MNAARFSTPGGSSTLREHPDFVFFHERGDQVRASIVDPHGHHLPDARIKLKALGTFARDYGHSFARIEAISQLGTSMRVLNLQVEKVREAAIHGTETALELYESDLAKPYDLVH